MSLTQKRLNNANRKLLYNTRRYGSVDNTNINNNYDRKLSIKRRSMTEKEREIAFKEMDEFLAKLRKKNGTTKY